MSVVNHDQDNKDQNVYYHPDPKLKGWTFMSISPMDSVLQLLVGKTIVNEKPEESEIVMSNMPEPRPITTEANTDCRKRVYAACFPFGHKQEIDEIIAKSKKTNSHAKASFGSNKDSSSLSMAATSSQTNVTMPRPMPQLPQDARTPGRRLPNLAVSTIKKKTVARFNPELYPMLSEEQKRIHDLVVNDKKTVFFSGSAGK